MTPEDFKAGMEELANVYNEPIEDDIWRKKLRSYWKALKGVRHDYWAQALALYMQDHRFFPKPAELLRSVSAIRDRQAAEKGVRDPCSECGLRSASYQSLCAACFDNRNGSRRPLFASTEDATDWEKAAARAGPLQGGPHANVFEYLEAIVKEATGKGTEGRWVV